MWRERQLEALELAREVRAQLLLGLREERVRAGGPGGCAERNLGEPAALGAQEQRADRGLDGVHAAHASAALTARDRRVRKPPTQRATMGS